MAEDGCFRFRIPNIFNYIDIFGGCQIDPTPCFSQPSLYVVEYNYMRGRGVSRVNSRLKRSGGSLPQADAV